MLKLVLLKNKKKNFDEWPLTTTQISCVKSTGYQYRIWASRLRENKTQGLVDIIFKLKMG